MTYLYLDIETIPAQRPDVLEEIRASKQAELTAALASIAPPSNYKKADLQASFDADVDEAYRRTGLDGAFGQVCVIGFALDGGEPQSYRVLDMSAEEEKTLLEGFSCALTDLIAPSEVLSTTVIGHNVAAFDLRFLVQRHIINGVRPHIVIARAAQAKPWEIDRVYDTLIQWAGNGAKAGGSLDKLCKALSIPSPKGAIDGSKVWDFVKDGRIAEVADYCAKDVAATRAVHRRMTFAA